MIRRVSIAHPFLAVVFLLSILPLPHEFLNFVRGESACGKHGLFCTCVVACTLKPDKAPTCHESDPVQETSAHCSKELDSTNGAPEPAEETPVVQFSARPWLPGRLMIQEIILGQTAILPLICLREITGHLTPPDQPPRLFQS
jgi:hypothetical protein